MDSERERKALLAKLELLDHMLRLHNWTAFEQKDAELEEKLEEKIDSEASGTVAKKKKSK